MTNVVLFPTRRKAPPRKRMVQACASRATTQRAHRLGRALRRKATKTTLRIVR